MKTMSWFHKRHYPDLHVSLGLILSSIKENNWTIEKLVSIVMYGVCFFVIVLILCMLKLK